jgi:CheY-like chemotaxis protein
VIDLSRLPAQGREIAIALRQSPRTRPVPILFLNGAAEKVELIRSVLPDAAYCTTETLVKTLKTAQPLPNAIVPVAMMDRYASRTAIQKLGIAEKSSIVLVDPPRNVTEVLGNLPKGAQFVEEYGDVTLYFAHAPDELRATMSDLRKFAAKTKLWILWRKKNATGHAGVTEPLVRETGRDLGLVDYKICSVDKTWSAMLFAQKK